VYKPRGKVAGGGVKRRRPTILSPDNETDAPRKHQKLEPKPKPVIIKKPPKSTAKDRLHTEHLIFHKSTSFKTCFQACAVALKNHKRGGPSKAKLIFYYIFLCAMKQFVGQEISQKYIVHTLYNCYGTDHIGTANEQRNRLAAHFATHLKPQLSGPEASKGVRADKKGGRVFYTVVDWERVKESYERDF
jgi:hypothetical protein